MLNWLFSEEGGQGMAEYGLILALISLVVFTLLSNLGSELQKVFPRVTAALNSSCG
jgi:pilus assembly protein Flp/PilA